MDAIWRTSYGRARTRQGNETRLLMLSLVPIAAALSACSDIERTSWELTAPPGDDPVLQLSVLVGDCDELDRFDVRETEVDVEGQLMDIVTIEACVKDDSDSRSVCDDVIYIEPHTVELSAPLGDRPLHGCNPPNAIYGDGVAPNDDCASWVAPE